MTEKFYKSKYGNVYYDLSGHGHSSIENYNKRYSLLAAECLEGLMDVEGIDKVILVGQSLGSFFSQRFQLKNPERVIATAHIGGAEFGSYAGSWAEAFIRKNSLKWHKKMQGSVLVEIEGANHIANQDNTDLVNEALLDFLESIK